MGAAKAAADGAKPGAKKKKEEEEVDPTKYTENRYAAIVDMKKSGGNPYPHKFPTDMSIPEYRAKFESSVEDGGKLEGTTAAVAGRVMSIRSSGGKLYFLDLHGDSEKIQVIAEVTSFDGANDSHAHLAEKEGVSPF